MRTCMLQAGTYIFSGQPDHHNYFGPVRADDFLQAILHSAQFDAGDLAGEAFLVVLHRLVADPDGARFLDAATECHLPTAHFYPGGIG